LPTTDRISVIEASEILNWHGKYPWLYTPLKVEIVKPKKDDEEA